ncbi:phage terminase small subunit P27 family [Methylobacterium isbiliense]|uniref:phage terminase small subunit P27 family n=1 Tax=Methylobacterium isbiliense TaxID=315478 RepID=UPI001EE1CF26|nr:phage terminase small subunit P27 family [Methylobacterium isbiliense]MDN3621456.1 phage terminase small subunit P27 family [Methylobacterium isbiliense]
MPRPPALLSTDARREWKRAAAVLVERKILTPADYETLASYCIAVGMRNDALRTLAKDGATFVTPAGMVKRHPAVGNLNDAIALAARLAAELGLTPVSRARVTASDDDADLSFLD